MSTSKFQDRELIEFGLSGSELSGQVAVVTGGGRGIGRELCLIMSQLGASVVVAEISEEGRRTADEINQCGGNGIYVKTDVSDENSVLEMINKSIKHFGHIDILVNNAIYCPVASVMDMDIEEWDKVIDVNLKGTFLCTKLVLKYMVSSEHGIIVTMVSAPSMPYLTAYTCTKQALESFAHSLAGEVEGKGVSVIAYGPGMVETPGGINAFKCLAEIYGMSYEQFINNGINPGYEGLIPAYDSAFVLAYIIAHAKEYHNQTTVMGEVLEKLIAEDSSVDKIVSTGIKHIRWKDICERASKVSANVCEIARITDEEFNKLPFFARPMARSGFKRKTGISNNDLNELLDNMSFFWNKALTTPPEEDDTYITEYLGRYGRITKILPGLCVYFREVPAETSRFIKDEKTIRLITKQAVEREEVCQSLYNILSEIEEPAS